MCYNRYVVDMRKKSSNKKKRKFSIYKSAGLILFIVSLILFVMLKKLDVLPVKYEALVILFLLVVNGVIDCFLFRKKAKKLKKNIAFGFACLFSILFIIPMFYMGKTMNFMSKIGASNYKLENYSLIVLKDSKLDKVSDVKGKSVGIYENTDGVKDAKEQLIDKVEVTFENYDNLEKLAGDLLESKIEVIFVEDSILSMMKEDNPDFEGNIKVIYTIKVKIKTSNKAKDVNVSNEPFNVYITGIDTYGELSSVSRSDVNIVMTVNPKTKQILLTSIPRDYYVELHGKKGSRDKLTHAGIYGTDMSIGTIEDLLGIDINYYVKINFSSFIDIINAIGGIEVYSKYTFTSIDGYNYTEGYNQMNGEEALSFARERKAFSEGDRQRGADQQAVIEAMIKKLSNKSILTKYDSLLKSIEGKFETNMSSSQITSLIKMQLNDMASWKVKSISLDGTNGKGVTYSGGSQELYVMIPDWNSVDEASSTIKAVLDGEILDEDFKPDKTKSTRVTKSYSTTVTNTEKKETKEEDKVEEKENNVTSVEEKISDDENDKEIEIVIDKNKDKNKDKSSDTSDDKKDDDKNNKVDNVDDTNSNEASSNKNNNTSDNDENTDSSNNNSSNDENNSNSSDGE